MEYERSQERKRQLSSKESVLLKCPSFRGVLCERVDLNQSGVGTLAGHCCKILILHAIKTGKNKSNFLK